MICRGNKNFKFCKKMKENDQTSNSETKQLFESLKNNKNWEVVFEIQKETGETILQIKIDGIIHKVRKEIFQKALKEEITRLDQLLEELWNKIFPDEKNIKRGKIEVQRTNKGIQLVKFDDQSILPGEVLQEKSNTKKIKIGKEQEVATKRSEIFEKFLQEKGVDLQEDVFILEGKDEHRGFNVRLYNILSPTEMRGMVIIGGKEFMTTYFAGLTLIPEVYRKLNKNHLQILTNYFPEIWSQEKWNSKNPEKIFK